MNRLWKYLSVLILLQLAMMAYIFLCVPKPSKVHSDNAPLRFSKKDLNIPDGQGTFNIITDVMKSNKSGKHSPLTHGRFYPSNNSVYFNGGIQLKAGKGKLLSLKKKRNFNRVIRTYTLESKESSRGDAKNTTLITTNVSLNHSNITKKCIFSINKNSLSEARKKIFTSDSVYLFFINLLPDNYKSSDSIETDMLFHWQYVLKKEKFLVQLPIDFDLFTFQLLSADSEEAVLDVTLLYNNSNCEESENLAEKIHSVRALLWNELFQNDTRFYLCNRNIETKDELSWRKIQYYITTIWVGYDLTCSEVSDMYGIHEVQLSKNVPLVTPFFCYFLSLQFVWIFGLLDTFEKTQIEELTHYTEDDRPYSGKRFIKKLLYKECEYCICYCCCCDQCKRCKCCCSDHVRKLLFLTYLFILLPVGLYRTLGRFFILDKKIYHNYITVVKPSEFFFSLIKQECVILILDTLYATLFPLCFVFIGERLYRIAKSAKGYDIRDNHNGNMEITQQSTKKFKPVIEIFSKPCGKLYKKSKLLISGIICCNCTGEDKLNENNLGKERCCCYKYSKNGQDGTCDCEFMFAGSYVFSSFFSCLFPIIPFSCVCNCICKNYNNSKAKDNAPNKKEELSDKISSDNSSIGFDSSDESSKVGDSCENNSCCNKCKRFMVFCSLLLLFTVQFIFIYFLCLRPVISTFTFMFRAFTYFVFVALLIRTHIMQFTLLFVTTLVYFLKYLSEIINMNVDILKYIITLQKNQSLSTNSNQNEEQIKQQTSQQTDQHKEPVEKQNDKVHEKTFTYIYEHLDFVRKKIYFLCLKTLVIFMYLFITIETFIRNKNSLNGTSVKSVVEFLLLIISPYAISIFLKTNKGDFLSDENKQEIKQKFEEFEEKELQNTKKTIIPPDNQDTKETNEQIAKVV